MTGRDAPAPAPMPAATCAECGVGAATPPLGWSREVGPQGEQWLCGPCTRRHVRAIEARLDSAWW